MIKQLILLKFQNVMDINADLLQRFIGVIESRIMPNQLPSNLATGKLAEELHKPVIRK